MCVPWHAACLCLSHSDVLCTYVCMYIRVYVCMYVCMYVCIRCVCVCVDVCMCVCMRVEIFILQRLLSTSSHGYLIDLSKCIVSHIADPVGLVTIGSQVHTGLGYMGQKKHIPCEGGPDQSPNLST